VSPNHEGNDSVAVRVHCLYGEEEVVAALTLEVIDRYINNEVPMATPGAQLKGLVRV
jgi:hypothetical protein